MKPKKFNNANDQKINDVLCKVWEAMEYKGYVPKNQLMYYLLSDDPIHITTYNNARKLITELDRDEIFKHIVDYYFND